MSAKITFNSLDVILAITVRHIYKIPPEKAKK